MNRCMRCWEAITRINNHLRCDACRKEVDKELNHEQNKPLAYYFSFYYRFLYKKNGWKGKK